MPADDPQLETIVGADLVYTVASPGEWAAGPDPASGSATLRTHESYVLALVDGRRTVADILLLSPLGHPATLQHLRTLYERGVLLRSANPERPPLRHRFPTGPNVVVIDTRHRDRTTAPREAPPNIRSFHPAEPSPAPASAGAAPTGASPGAGAAAPFRLGRYEIAARIGQGGMGSIYVCRVAGAAGTDHLLTLKVVRQYSDQQEVAAQSLLREGRIAGRLNHANVQRVVDTGTYKGQPFLILDYIAGVSLSDALAGERRPPIPVIVSILIDVLRGLEAAHNLTDQRGQPMGLVHADVSPPNVLVGIDGLARITDFGSSWIFSEDRDARTNAAALGKPSYMSPEQLMAEPLDARTDIFALGAVMHLALTGQELFLADTYEQVVMNVLRKRIAPPSELGAPPALDAICMRALSRAKEGRFQTAAQMAEALFQVAAAQELVASPREVADYIKREFGEIVDEQQRQIQRAFEMGAPSTQGSGSWVLPPSDAPAHRTPAQGIRVTEGPGAGRPANDRHAADGSRGKGRPLAKTLFIPSSDAPSSDPPISDPPGAVSSGAPPGGAAIHEEPPPPRPARPTPRVEQRRHPSGEQRRPPSGEHQRRPPSGEHPRRPSGEQRRLSSELTTLRKWLVAERRVILLAVAFGVTTLAITIAMVRPAAPRRPAPAATATATGPTH